jgi:hypothetical protein
MTIGRRLLPWAVAAVGVGVVSISLIVEPVSAGPQQRRPRSELIVITHCVYLSPSSSSASFTELRAIEVSGGDDIRIEPGGRCSDAISQLFAQGFTTASATSTTGDFDSNGVVDAADYVVWRKTDPTP